jgi:hypothetical protein
LSLLYLTFLTEEPIKRDGQLAPDISLTGDAPLAEKIRRLGHFFVVDPLVKMTKTMVKKRTENRRFLLLLQVSMKTIAGNTKGRIVNGTFTLVLQTASVTRFRDFPNISETAIMHYTITCVSAPLDPECFKVQGILKGEVSLYR